MAGVKIVLGFCRQLPMSPVAMQDYDYSSLQSWLGLWWAGSYWKIQPWSQREDRQFPPWVRE